MNIWLHKKVIELVAANGGKVPADLLQEVISVRSLGRYPSALNGRLISAPIARATSMRSSRIACHRFRDRHFHAEAARLGSEDRRCPRAFGQFAVTGDLRLLAASDGKAQRIIARLRRGAGEGQVSEP